MDIRPTSFGILHCRLSIYNLIKFYCLQLLRGCHLIAMHPTSFPQTHQGQAKESNGKTKPYSILIDELYDAI